ncbi:hypothetical protein MRB53_034748 [Persea americana]|uniref:Uncharacterized protein n=1 Tax=Persea americana TaxID=3435 RepID=A0ACC2K2M6_PERAE|nr:hypothetical protein MRB53_034748 [Persea americana]
MASLHSPSPPPSFSSSEKEEEGEESASQSSETSYFIKPHQDLNRTLLPKSTEEDDEEEEEEEDPEEDPEEDDLQNQKALVLKADDDPEEESGESGFPSGSEAKLAVAVLSHGAPNPNIQPISSIGASRIKKSVSKPLLLESAKRSAQKRTAAAAAPPEQTDMDSEDRRQKKRLNADAQEHLPTDEEDSKKGGLRNEGDEVKEEAAVDRKLHPFQRIWSPKDEIAVLTAMIKYLRDPSGNSSDKAAFHAFVRERVRMDVTRSQVGDKVRRFKKKFLKRVNNAVSRGKEPAFSNEHERLVYELSKQIWGDNGLEPDNCPEIKDGGGINATKDEVKNTAGALYPYLIESLQSSGVKELGEFDLDRVLKLIDHSQAKEWNERWMDIRSKERNIYMERLTLVHQQIHAHFVS